MSAHSWRSQGPAAEWMALSMQACSGWKHPRRVRRVDDRVGPDRCDVAAPQRQARVHLRSRQAEGVDGFSLSRLGGQEPL